MEQQVSIIIQARLTSKRFEKKVLEKIKDKTLISFLLSRLKYAKGYSNIIFAIPKNKKNNELYRYLNKFSYINIFRGKERDVLSRYYEAAKCYNSDIIVRITSDCPLVDPFMLTKMINFYKNNNFDYISNVRPRTFPDGLDIEIFNFKSLKQANLKSKLKRDREHVTRFISRSKKFSKFNFLNKKDYSKIRWTIDTKSDLIILNKFLKNYSKKYLSWKKLLTLYNKYN